jgi:hypothetical protein
MTESLQKIRDALAKYAPSVTPIESCGGDNDGRIIDSLLFVGRRLAFLASEYADGYVELFCRESDCNEAPCRLLVREKWHTACKLIILLESNRVSWIQSDAPIRLKDRSGRVDTVIGSGSCQG